MVPRQAHKTPQVSAQELTLYHLGYPHASGSVPRDSRGESVIKIVAEAEGFAWHWEDLGTTASTCRHYLAIGEKGKGRGRGVFHLSER